MRTRVFGHTLWLARTAKAEGTLMDETSGSERGDRFRAIRLLANHWSRPPGPRSYNWYLTFGDSAEVQLLAKRCQAAIAFVYYDLTPPERLHLTLDRIAFHGDLTSDQLTAITAAAAQACREISPLTITIASLGGTLGALGFDASPRQPICDLRNALRAATLSVYPHAPFKRSEFHPHIAIAYCTTDGILAADAIAAVQKLNLSAGAETIIKEAALVLLGRRERAYYWKVISRIRLAS